MSIKSAFKTLLSVKPLLLGAWVTFSSTPIAAHEYWITPNSFTSTSQVLIWRAYVGEGLESNKAQAFDVDASRKFWINGTPASADALAFSNDRNTVSFNSATPIFLMAHTTNAAIHTHQSLDDFKQFTEEEGLPEIYQQHIEDDLPSTLFNEIFYRHTKTLLCGENPSQTNANVGLKYEWVALDNPYAADNNELSFQLTTNNAPIAQSPVVVFHQESENAPVQRQRFTTDNQGKINLSHQPGKYLINATIIQRTSTKTLVSTGAIWQSDWASILFDTTKPCA